MNKKKKSILEVYALMTKWRSRSKSSISIITKLIFLPPSVSFSDQNLNFLMVWCQNPALQTYILGDFCLVRTYITYNLIIFVIIADFLFFTPFSIILCSKSHLCDGLVLQACITTVYFTCFLPHTNLYYLFMQIYHSCLGPILFYVFPVQD